MKKIIFPIFVFIGSLLIYQPVESKDTPLENKCISPLPSGTKEYLECEIDSMNKTVLDNDKRISELSVPIKQYESEFRPIIKKLAAHFTVEEIADLKDLLANYKIERLASDKLTQIASSKLESDTNFYIAASLILALASATLLVVVKLMIANYKKSIDLEFKNVTNTANDLATTVKKATEDADDFVKTTKEKIASLERYREDEFDELMLNTYQSFAVIFWENKLYYKAIDYGKEALSIYEKKYTQYPDDPERRSHLVKLKSELAYYIASAKDTRRSNDAVIFAKVGLKEGIKRSNLDLIDNYLFVMSRFMYSMSDQKRWVNVYDDYHKILKINGIWDEKEADMFRGIYSQYKQTP